MVFQYSNDEIQTTNEGTVIFLVLVYVKTVEKDKEKMRIFSQQIDSELSTPENVITNHYKKQYKTQTPRLIRGVPRTNNK